jgi:hypothetical protein
MNLPVVRAELAFDTIRVYLNDIPRMNIRRSAYRFHHAWKWKGNWKVEFILECPASAPVRQIWQLEERRISGSS